MESEDIAEDMGGANEKRIEIVSRILDKRFSKGRGKRWVHRDLDAARTELRDYKVSQSDSAKQATTSSTAVRVMSRLRVFLVQRV